MIKIPSKISSVLLPLLCTVACVHLAMALPTRLPVDTERYPRATFASEAGTCSNVTAGSSNGSSNSSSSSNGTACCNATSPLGCFDRCAASNVGLECDQPAATSNLTQQLSDRGSLDRGLAILNTYSASLFNITVSACACAAYIRYV